MRRDGLMMKGCVGVKQSCQPINVVVVVVAVGCDGMNRKLVAIVSTANAPTVTSKPDDAHTQRRQRDRCAQSGVHQRPTDKLHIEFLCVPLHCHDRWAAALSPAEVETTAFRIQSSQGW